MPVKTKSKSKLLRTSAKDELQSKFIERKSHRKHPFASQSNPFVLCLPHPSVSHRHPPVSPQERCHSAHGPGIEDRRGESGVLLAAVQRVHCVQPVAGPHALPAQGPVQLLLAVVSEEQGERPPGCMLLIFSWVQP